MLPGLCCSAGGDEVPANADKILELIFTGGTALAGLILVFLGASLAHFDTYTAIEKGDVRPKYRKRAYTALAGFLAALLSAVASLIAYGSPCAAFYYGALALLGVSFIMTTWAAVVAVLDIG
jgi:hypothetical protein